METLLSSATRLHHDLFFLTIKGPTNPRPLQILDPSSHEEFHSLFSEKTDTGISEEFHRKSSWRVILIKFRRKLIPENMRNSIEKVPDVWSSLKETDPGSRYFIWGQGTLIIRHIWKKRSCLPEFLGIILYIRRKLIVYSAPELKPATRNSVGGARNSGEEFRTKNVRICRTLSGQCCRC